MRDVAVQDTPPTVSNQEEAAEHRKHDRRHREKVHRRDSLPMIPQGKRASAWQAENLSERGVSIEK